MVTQYTLNFLGMQNTIQTDLVGLTVKELCALHVYTVAELCQSIAVNQKDLQT